MKSLIRKSDDQEAPFVCIEPWYGRCDNKNFTGEWKDREWGNSLDAGQIPPLLLACLFCFTPITFLQSEI